MKYYIAYHVSGTLRLLNEIPYDTEDAAFAEITHRKRTDASLFFVVKGA